MGIEELAKILREAGAEVTEAIMEVVLMPNEEQQTEKRLVAIQQAREDEAARFQEFIEVYTKYKEEL